MKSKLIAILVLALTLTACTTDTVTETSTSVADPVTAETLPEVSTEEVANSESEAAVSEAEGSSVEETSSEESQQASEESQASSEESQVSSEEVESSQEASVEPAQGMTPELEAKIKDELLQPVADMEIGTSGSSLKTANLAADWLNVLGEEQPLPEDVARIAKEFVDGLEGNDQAMFMESYIIISQTAENLAIGDEVTIAALEDSGGILNDNALEPQAWGAYKSVLDATLGVPENQPATY